MRSRRYDHTGRCWRCLHEARIDEFREEGTSDTRYYLTLDDKPWQTYRTLRGAKIAARYHGAFGDWIEEATADDGWLEIG